jgi:histone demethylase JARID1
MEQESVTPSGDRTVPTVKSENGAASSMKADVDYELPDLPEAPVFYPTAEEFADPMKYLDSIRAQAEPAGVIKIVPPKEWRCPFPIKEHGDSFHFQTCVQSVDQLRHRHGPGTKFMQRLRHFHRTRGLHLPAEARPLLRGLYSNVYFRALLLMHLRFREIISLRMLPILAVLELY